MSPASQLWYVYGITPSTIDVRRAPEGVDDTPIELCVDDDLAAVASRLDPEAVRRLTDPAHYLGSSDGFVDRVLAAAASLR